ncbi:phosphonate ABC transporter ATP-binding protein [Enterococcus faecium]|uniref:phosphonate ABC transporter ATP-binding protein n=1 Tax=Enterococcus faecium TaxID=1352 RepID=UPI000F4EAA34|nr:phosphonate ABC transporter ATP-binding protein [Enterococcus faecium]EGP5493831.1 phosphonate ABC transporter ATP-binding protein [Enterococcus faecium]EGP5624173.1 phosphonate ABC transporter ATP-binding protein [Enterococcus faecium]EGW0027178.1 phosphonate ABC transporter ATP-binding protein [Enterococcus faecium]EME7121831.1 phosphonate ABC transporter ATP-binding protein [Enterococcus faecium]EME7125492.1 phosphonate ABC transporter ATP-binding protein [Enterococcus faecium]
MLLEVKNITKTYPNGNHALQDISFSLEKGEFVSIIGPSGAGKSTILRTINRLIEADSGTIRFEDREMNELKRKELRKKRRRIGMIFQHYNLVSRLTVIENVLHGCLGYKTTLSGAAGLYREEEKEQAFDLIEKVDLSAFAYTRCDELSGGQKQRVGIARALMQNPALILCDEPIASLDPKSAKTIMDYLKRITNELAITSLVNLHQVETAIDYSDRIIGVNSGKIVFEGRPYELTKEKIETIYQSKKLLV